MSDYQDVSSVLDSAPKDINIKKRAKWIASALLSIDLEDDAVKNKLLACVDKSKDDHPNWQGKRYFVDACAIEMRWTYKYLRKHDKKLAIRDLKQSRNFLEVLSMLSLWSSMEAIAKMHETYAKDHPKHGLNSPGSSR